MSQQPLISMQKKEVYPILEIDWVHRQASISKYGLDSRCTMKSQLLQINNRHLWWSAYIRVVQNWDEHEDKISSVLYSNFTLMHHSSIWSISNKRNQWCGIRSSGWLSDMDPCHPSSFNLIIMKSHLLNRFLWQIPFDNWSSPYLGSIMSRAYKNWRPHTCLLFICPFHYEMTRKKDASKWNPVSR